MAKIKLTKTELKAQTDALKRFQRFLPMLQLKKQQLQGEIAGIVAQADAVTAREKAVRAGLDAWVGLFATGDVVFYGKGAGKLPTASAVVADVIDCVKHFKARKYLFWEDAKPNYVADFGSMETSAFVRVSAKDSDTALNTAADVFGKITPLLAKRPVQGEAGFTVENLTEKELSDKLAALEARGVKVEGRIRISDY